MGREVRSVGECMFDESVFGEYRPYWHVVGVEQIFVFFFVVLSGRFVEVSFGGGSI